MTDVRAPVATDAPEPVAEEIGEFESPGLPVSRRARATAAFGIPAFRSLWFNTFGFALIQSTQRFAYVWLALELGGGPGGAGLTAFAMGFPILVLALPAGVLSDRSDRRVLLGISQLGALVVTAVTALLLALDVMTVPLTILMAFGLGASTAFGQPVRQAIVPSIVEREVLMNAIVLMTMGMNVSMIVGPALGGGVIALWGLTGAFIFQSFLYVLSGLPLLRLRLPPVLSSMSERRGGQIREGISFITAHSGIRTLFILLTFSGLFMMGPFMALLPQIAREELGAKAFAASMLFTSLGLGMLSASLLLASLGHLARKGLWFNGMLITGGLGLTGIGLSRWYVLSLVLMFLWGVGGGFFMNLNQTLIQSNTPQDLMGRVMSVHTLAFMGGGPLGALLAGGMGRAIGAPAWMAIAGLILAGAAIFTLVAQPGLRRMD